MAAKTLNPNAEVMGKSAALMMNINAAKGMYDVLKTNLGPKGTIKMLVGGSGDLKLTKDGNVLLREMQIQHPTAMMIARTATAQDDITGDGTSSTVLLIGDLLKQSERYLSDGLHPRVLVEGFEVAKRASLEFLETFKQDVDTGFKTFDREMLRCVARTSLGTKVTEVLAEQLTDIVTDAVTFVRPEEGPVDLHMVEIMHMRHKFQSDTRLVKGLVLDHGARHPDMKKHVENAYILTCNISLEYEKSEINSGFFYSSADQRDKLVKAERKFTDMRVEAVIALKKKMCDGTDKNFVVINQKGIDPISLEMLARAGIVALRRAKKRNMERLVLCCGGYAVNSELELLPEACGFAGKVYEHVLGDEVYTFVEEPKKPGACTVLIKGQNDHSIAQIKDAVRDGLRAVNNVLNDSAVVQGAGAFEVAATYNLRTKVMATVQGRAKLGVEAFAEALLVIPKTLAENSGFDAQEKNIELTDEYVKGNVVGLDVVTGDPMSPSMLGVYDNFCVKRQILHSAPVIASQLLLVDEVMRAGMNMRRG
mmetsp:Transcript_18797/g.41128  ORF Transcript_18797/g.41128 Transcript_18797/m.41128 type:complete len:536 (-) Transcript_18797:342-1949(-)|eukprot:CAMPEP_0118932644 /NCGR_PEP_ID=MMETSP1169-20130426/10544_1 /TAXON_ID=36882 /ORGANISM="Pyramimonas obovata, Strain CCMP722" /LENGTH=535 /DNA_ID=CAMNT_0006875335 /DNA_START=202 /DNA_END=1809 /DNA_ORIENTATION=+